MKSAKTAIPGTDAKLRNEEYLPLPVVDAPVGGQFIVTDGDTTFIVPDDVAMVGFKAFVGNVQVLGRSAGNEGFPATWPPTSGTTGPDARWQEISYLDTQERCFAVEPGDKFRVHIPAASGAKCQILWWTK